MVAISYYNLPLNSCIRYNWYQNGWPWCLPQGPGELIRCVWGGKFNEGVLCSPLIGGIGRVRVKLWGVLASVNPHWCQPIKNPKMQPRNNLIHNNHQPHPSIHTLKITANIPLEGGQHPTQESRVVPIHPNYSLNLQKSINDPIGAINHDLLHTLIPK